MLRLALSHKGLSDGMTGNDSIHDPTANPEPDPLHDNPNGVSEASAGIEEGVNEGVYL